MIVNQQQSELSLAAQITYRILGYYQQKIDKSCFAELSKICQQIIVETMKGHSHIKLEALSKVIKMPNDRLSSLLSQFSFLFVPSEECLNVNDKAFNNNLTPFILHQENIYMGRYWRAEQKILDKLKQINQYHANHSQVAFPHTEDLKKILSPLISTFSDSQQNIIKLISNTRVGVSIISGEAGCGKSWSCMQILKTIEDHQAQSLIAICAPTGKAVSRLSSELGEASNIHIQTIHKLLNISPNNHYARFHQENLLAYEFILIDEVSMIDIELLAQLVNTVRDDCKIILIGDPAQLAAIGVGGGLNLIQQHFPENHIHLQEQHRFQQNSEINQLANLAKQGQLLTQKLNLPHSLQADEQEQEKLLEQWLERYFYPCYQSQSYDELLNNGVLSPWRRFDKGILKLNQMIQQKLYEANFIETANGLCEGLVIVIRSNNPKQQIYNGDKAYLKNIDGDLHAIFPEKKDHQIPLTQLFHFDLAFAMTIHQMQGSEMDNVFLWLDTIDEQATAWLSNHLLYTSITRAKKSIQICADARYLNQHMIKITELNLYPIKSCRGIDKETLLLTEKGLAIKLPNGMKVYDRQWMLVSSEGRFLTQREFPEMARIQIQTDDSGLLLSHPKTTKSFHLQINPELNTNSPKINSIVWGSECQGYDEGDDISHWLTSLLGMWENKPIRLLKFNPAWRRELELKNAPNADSIEKLPTTHFADSYPYLITNQKSLEALNSHLEKIEMAVPMDRFRGNIIINGLAAWAEHSNIQLQEQYKKYHFMLIAPCPRCKIISIDQQNTQIQNINQPNQTLRSVNPHYINQKNAYFGQNAILLEGEGMKISIGDTLIQA